MSRSRVVLCSMDGVRPDAIHATHTPTIDRLAREGAACWAARTVMPSSTLPCHTSMLRGVDTARHGITTNTFHPLVRPVPSLIDAAYDQGRTTGFFYNWEPLRDLAAPGKLHVSLMYHDCKSPEGDRYVAEQARPFSPARPRPAVRLLRLARRVRAPARLDERARIWRRSRTPTPASTACSKRSQTRAGRGDDDAGAQRPRRPRAHTRHGPGRGHADPVGAARSRRQGRADPRRPRADLRHLRDAAPRAGT
jgi:hypothetical protein